VHNFETAQHIDKQKIYLVSTINALKIGTKLGITPRGFDATYREKVDELQMIRKNVY